MSFRIIAGALCCSLLLSVFAHPIVAQITAVHVTAVQGTPGGKTVPLTGFKESSEEFLQAGEIQLFDGISTFGWKGNARIEDGKLYFAGNVEDTPYWFSDQPVFEVRYSEQLLRGTRSVPMCLNKENMKPLFDGKTLTGWTPHGNIQAQVSDGVIVLGGGAGCLESEGQYADFFLQLEYFTPIRPEGKGVNSGVFFRCIPKEIMNGYECQILNKAGEADYKNFIGTDTGGIFRRQVGRNVAPQDGKWNYLTIVAKGTRMSTWVNGIQTADWTDERPAHNNPRNGKRTEAGTIQFQSHDPATEIQFRNIRMIEL